MTQKTINKKWYVLYAGDPRRISALPTMMKSSTIDSSVWVPMKKICLKIKGKNRDVQRPLFPGYVFINIDLEDGKIEDLIKETCGGYFLKRPGGISPMALTDQELVHLRELTDEKQSSAPISERYDLEENQKVEIASGPFLGTMGIIREIKRDKVVVEVSIFGRNVLAEVDPSVCYIINENE